MSMPGSAFRQPDDIDDMPQPCPECAGSGCGGVQPECCGNLSPSGACRGDCAVPVQVPCEYCGGCGEIRRDGQVDE